MSIPKLILVIIISLLLGVLTLNTFAPRGVNFVIIVVITFLIFNTTLYKNNIYDFILIIYATSFFQYGNNVGGTFNLVAFFVAVLYFLKNFIDKNHNNFIFKNKNRVIQTLLLLIIIPNFIGLIVKNKSSMFDLSIGIISFLSFIIVFILTSNIKIDEKKIEKFLIISNIFLTYSMIISLGKLFGILKSNLPFLGFEGKVYSDNLGGTFGASSIGGEIALLYFLFSIPYMLSKKINSKIKFNINVVYYSIFISAISILLANSRSAIILFIFAFGLIFIVNQFSLINALSNRFRFIMGIFIIGFILLFLAPYLNLDKVVDRFMLIDTTNLTYEGVTEGYGINRIDAFRFGVLNMIRESWWVGYGWGTLESNRFAWFGDSQFYRQDPHSIYFSLPMIWGWIGGASFLLIILYLIKKTFNALVLKHNSNKFIVQPVFGMFFLFVFFLINEYKITAMSYANYFMIIWIFMGIGYSIINSLKYENN